MSISYDIVSTSIYDKRDDFEYEIINFPILDGDVYRSLSYGIYISQLIRFARASSHAADFNTPNKLLAQKFLKQGFWYDKLHETSSKFSRLYYGLTYNSMSHLNIACVRVFRNQIVYKLKKSVGICNFSAQFIKIISHYKNGYNINVLQQTACLVVNPITVGNFAFSLVARRRVRHSMTVPA